MVFPEVVKQKSFTVRLKQNQNRVRSLINYWKAQNIIFMKFTHIDMPTFPNLALKLKEGSK